MKSSASKVGVGSTARGIAVGPSKSASNGYVRTKDGSMKFVGGAALARRAAVKQKGNRILRPGEKEEAERVLHVSMSPFERFLTGILRAEPSEFLNNPRDTWKSICKRLNLRAPEKPLKASYDNQKLHFAYRAALVLEEARYAVAEGLALLRRNIVADEKRKKQNNQRNKKGFRIQDRSNKMILTLSDVQFNQKTGNSKLTFTKNGRFTPYEIDNLRQGTIFACLGRGLAQKIPNYFLGCILPANRDEIIKSTSFSVLVCREIKAAPDTPWELVPITSLLAEQRKFEACTSTTTASVPFLFPLLGGKEGTHTRFVEDGEGNSIGVEVAKKGPSKEKITTHKNEMPGVFRLKPLNSSQERAASEFLKAKSNTITIIQGPPGTGKTTLLVSVICRYVMESIRESKSRCLMVCAPTNKAVSVLCTRFLDTMGEDRPCNIVLVGDDDKLLDDDNTRGKIGGPISSMRSVFLYTWIGTVLNDYNTLKQRLCGKDRIDAKSLALLSRRIEMRIQHSLEDDRSILSSDILEGMNIITSSLETWASTRDHSSQKIIMDQIDKVMDLVRKWKNEEVWKALLGSAHIVFCTLASAGTGIIKKSICEVDDLIVDEAAACTEPEMYIPFTYRPKRLLAVGDPKQLPATVTSQIADELGMSKSLHERLMYECGHKHIMLDVQYRMKPEISAFPSKTFYDGILRNGSNVSKPGYQGVVSILNGQQYSFLHVHGSERQSWSGSFENHYEAKTIVDLIQKLKQVSRGAPGKWNSVDRVRIITFYQAQVAMLKRMLYDRGLGEVVVATVDSSQGCEADIVIISFVRSPGESERSSVGFLSDDRRMNVALTRAKYQMICVGNFERMLNTPNPKAATVRSLVEDAQRRNCISPNISSRNNQKKGSHEDRNSEQQKRKRERNPDSSGIKNRRGEVDDVPSECQPEDKRRKFSDENPKAKNIDMRDESNGTITNIEQMPMSIDDTKSDNIDTSIEAPPCSRIKTENHAKNIRGNHDTKNDDIGTSIVAPSCPRIKTENQAKDIKGNHDAKNDNKNTISEAPPCSHIKTENYTREIRGNHDSENDDIDTSSEVTSSPRIKAENHAGDIMENHDAKNDDVNTSNEAPPYSHTKTENYTREIRGNHDSENDDFDTSSEAPSSPRIKAENYAGDIKENHDAKNDDFNTSNEAPPYSRIKMENHARDIRGNHRNVPSMATDIPKRGQGEEAAIKMEETEAISADLGCFDSDSESDGPSPTSSVVDKSYLKRVSFGGSDDSTVYSNNSDESVSDEIESRNDIQFTYGHSTSEMDTEGVKQDSIDETVEQTNDNDTGMFITVDI